ncbi:phosphotransferase [Pseudonocardia kunmingensis]|uniref:Aminoglycoside phosphotransferase (APT) family kinase protein n=1 Tax=Pseudonocardia kunmingensis TaxID=630975 RepID=A0A543D4H3_9PSEU|nr:phosphotransferase [Pseudonocardia kunmingensis]TQM04231.1 aminoglycoside phosphotransferase (APT) family kinase protein [Pseudonocardia kunmingensis]
MPDAAPPPAATPLAPVPRLDAAALVAALRAHTGEEFELVGPLPGGQVGAALVRRPGRREEVLTHWGGASDATWARVARTGALLERARDAGIPAPRYALVARLPERIAVVQERLPGEPPTRVDLALVQEMVAIAGRGAGLLRERRDVPAAELHLLRSGPGFCLHESLAQYDERTRRLLDLVRRIGTGHASRMAGDDLVHLDFHPGNVLVDRTGTVTGVIDWDSVGRGDHRFALVTLRFDLAVPGTGAADRSARAAATRWLDNRIDDLFGASPDGAATLRAYWAHMGLRQVDWAIRHHGPDDVDRWLTVAAARLA